MRRRFESAPICSGRRSIARPLARSCIMPCVSGPQPKPPVCSAPAAFLPAVAVVPVFPVAGRPNRPWPRGRTQRPDVAAPDRAPKPADPHKPRSGAHPIPFHAGRRRRSSHIPVRVHAGATARHDERGQDPPLTRQLALSCSHPDEWDAAPGARVSAVIRRCEPPADAFGRQRGNCPPALPSSISAR